LLLALVVLVLAVVATWRSARGASDRVEIGYAQFLELVRDGEVEAIRYDADTGTVEGELVDGRAVRGHNEFEARGPAGELPADDVALLERQGVDRDYDPPSTDWPAALIYFVVPLVLLAVVATVGIVGAVLVQRRRRP
jgi:hypothetical protein